MGLQRPSRGGDDRTALLRAGGLVVVCTLVTTAAFVGILSLVSGRATGVETRMPAYVLVLALTFVGSVLVLEQRTTRGTTARTVIIGAITAAIVAFVSVALGVEGLLYALTYPTEVVSSRVLFYFLAAALIGTGVGYWGVHHRRELAQPLASRL